MTTWITTQQAADKLGVSRAWIIRLIHAGRIVAEKFGRDWKVNPYSLKNYEATKRSPGRPPGTDKAAIRFTFGYPNSIFLEKTGTFTNSERRVQLFNEAIKPIGNSRPDWQIVCDVATRMGYPFRYDGTAEVMDEIASVAPIYGGMSHEEPNRRVAPGLRLVDGSPAAG